MDLKTSKDIANKTFCYWTVADGHHAKMAQTMVKSARDCGVQEDFHIWTDMEHINGANVHKCGTFEKSLYMFKFHFLKEQVSSLNYDYYVFLDADNYFVNHPGDFIHMMDGHKIFAQMENEITSPNAKRKDWWGCPVEKYKPLYEETGLKLDKIYNTNAGFWIVDKNYIDEFYNIGLNFFFYAKKKGYYNFTEEVSLAFLGHCMQNPEERTLEKTSWLWASDWTGYWRNKLPEYADWTFEDYMTGDKFPIKSNIVHCMRSKNILIKAST
jgi:hypothetical protein